MSEELETHTHEEDGFDIVLPSWTATYLPWALLALSTAYLGYLVWSEFRFSQRTKDLDSVVEGIRERMNEPFKQELLVAVVPHVPDPADESEDL